MTQPPDKRFATEGRIDALAAAAMRNPASVLRLETQPVVDAAAATAVGKDSTVIAAAQQAAIPAVDAEIARTDLLKGSDVRLQKRSFTLLGARSIASEFTLVGGTPVFGLPAKFGSGALSGAIIKKDLAAPNGYELDTYYTYECWMRRNTLPAGNEVVLSMGTNNYIMVGASNGYVSFNHGSSSRTTTTINACDGAWHHIAFIFKRTATGTEFGYAFVDGVAVTSTVAATTETPSTTMTVNGFSTNAYAFAGYVDEVRLSKGARYTAAFTPPTVEFASDANTLTLSHMEDARVMVGGTIPNYYPVRPAQYAATGVKDLTIARGPEPSFSATTKFGTRSFDPKDATVLSAPNLMDTGYAGTIVTECWFNRVSGTIATNEVLLELGGSFWLGLSTTGQVIFAHGDAPANRVLTNRSGLNDGAWHHVAWEVNRVAGVANYVHAWLDGVMVTEPVTYSAATKPLSATLGIGGFVSAGTGFESSALIDEVRISKASRYASGNITVPIKAFDFDSNTIFLSHLDNLSQITAPGPEIAPAGTVIYKGKQKPTDWLPNDIWIETEVY